MKKQTRREKKVTKKKINVIGLEDGGKDEHKEIEKQNEVGVKEVQKEQETGMLIKRKSGDDVVERCTKREKTQVVDEGKCTKGKYELYVLLHSQNTNI